MSSRTDQTSLWPTTPFVKTRLRQSLPSDIESWAASNFHNGFPVFVSSGRAAISMICKLLNNQKAVGLFPFASQCVVNAFSINGISTYTAKNLETSQQLVYHQWGYELRQLSFKPLIEDSVDSLYKLGASVRSLDSRFEIWSFSKILGTFSGGLVWCRSEEDANQLRLLVEKTPCHKAWFKFLLKKMMRVFPKLIYSKWEKYELSYFNLTSYEIGEINSIIDRWGELWEIRLNQIRSLEDDLKTFGFKEILDWATTNQLPQRLPAALCVTAHDPELELRMNMSATRSLILHRVWIENSEYKFRRVILIPIHHHALYSPKI